MGESIFDSEAFNTNLFFPRPDRQPTPPGAEEIFIDVGGDVRIHTRRHPNSRARWSLLYFHGNGEIVADYDDMAEVFSSLGAELIVCDYRGYGRSGGRPQLRTVMRDAHRIFDFLKDSGQLKNCVCVMGRSLGSASAIDLCAERKDIAGMVIESGYSDPIPLVQRRGLKIDTVTPEEHAVFNNGEKIARVCCPTLILHGAEDELISPDEALLNFRLCGAEKKYLEILDDVGHNDILASPDYFPRLRDFFDSVLQPA
jgi:hypothetical protein